MTSIVLTLETTTLYNSSLLKRIDWEKKSIYIRFEILNYVFSTVNWYFELFNSAISGQADGGENVHAYSCEGLGLSTFLLGNFN